MGLPMQILETHLFANAYQAIQDQFRDDPSDLTNEEGVNYEYNGKIWNIRIGFQRDGSDEITAVFIRVHSDAKIFGDEFRARPNNHIYHNGISIEFIDYQEETDPQGSPKSDRNHNFNFLPLLNKGTRKDVVKIPTVSKEIRDRCARFFNSCPELIPPYIDPHPQKQ